MSKFFFLLVISLSLISCGNAETKKLQQFAAARGPIKSACMNSGRDKATTQLCGCAQVAASQALTYEDQQRGAAFFSDPSLAQKVRASDTSRDDAFWERWYEFGNAAQQLCA